MNRAELQQLAEDRILDAEALLAAGRWSGAYYLAGYAVECGLKVCVINFLMATDQFPEKNYSLQCWTHDLAKLVELTGLKSVLDTDTATNPALKRFWAEVKDWDEASRYDQKTQAQAERLFEAVTNNPDGVMQWIRLRW